MVHFAQSCPMPLFDSRLWYMPLGMWVTPFGRPGIIARLPLPRAFRGLPRPSSPRRPKASAYGPSVRLAILPLTGPPLAGQRAPSWRTAPRRQDRSCCFHFVITPQRNHDVLIVSVPRNVKYQVPPLGRRGKEGSPARALPQVFFLYVHSPESIWQQYFLLSYKRR